MDDQKKCAAWRTVIRSFYPCQEAIDWLRTQESAQIAWETCPRGDWLLWIAVRLLTDAAGHRIVVLAACDCADTALALLPPGEERPRKCVATVRAWARGEATIKDVMAAGRHAAAAADDAAAAADDAAYAAAYAAAAAADDAAYAAAYAAAAAARSAHLQKLGDIVRARIPWTMVEPVLLAAQQRLAKQVP